MPRQLASLRLFSHADAPKPHNVRKTVIDDACSFLVAIGPSLHIALYGLGTQREDAYVSR